jgi:hypothetical protein
MASAPTRWLASVNSIQVVDRVAEHVTSAVDAGDLVPGTELSRRELAATFETSTDMVDTALARLTANGSLVHHGNSVVVRPLDPAELRRAYELRTVLEPQLNAESARTWTADHFALLSHGVETRDDPTASLAARRAANLRMRELTTAVPQLRWQGRVLDMAWLQIDRFIPLVARTQLARGDNPWPDLGTDFLDTYERRSPKAIFAWWREYLDRSWVLAEKTLGDLDCQRAGRRRW